jgi:hypothetical protein
MHRSSFEIAGKALDGALSDRRDACIQFGPSSDKAEQGDPLKAVHNSFVESGLR